METLGPINLAVIKRWPTNQSHAMETLKLVNLAVL